MKCSNSFLQRKNILLKEYEKKDRSGGIVDRRFGENDPTMTPEERMLERFTKERQRASRGTAFNLEDEDELTHYGQSLSKLDDFDNVGLGLDNEDDESDGKLGLFDTFVVCAHSVLRFQVKLTMLLCGRYTLADSMTKRMMRRVNQEKYAQRHTQRVDADMPHFLQPPRKKSKAEVMAEVMAKSKQHKVRVPIIIL